MVSKTIKIDHWTIGGDYPVFVIAEAGVNHNGSLKMAMKIIDAAKSAGADAVKFQTFITEDIVTKRAPKALYQRKTDPKGSQFAMIKKLELSKRDFKELFYYAKKKGIIFLSTPFDPESAVFLHRLGVGAFKISSGDMNNLPLLSKIAKYRKPVILSTGMATLSEVGEAVRTLYSTGNKKLVLLHCTSNYPARIEDVNLKAIITLAKEFRVPVGYSDHTEGPEVAIAASAIGACIIEKHITLDNNLPGPDHKASMEPEAFRDMVHAVRNVYRAMGNGIKIPRRSESEVRRVARKSVVASREVSRGARITEDMLAIKRPGTGIEPKYLNKVIGKIARRRIVKDELLSWGSFK